MHTLTHVNVTTQGSLGVQLPVPGMDLLAAGVSHPAVCGRETTLLGVLFVCYVLVALPVAGRHIPSTNAPVCICPSTPTNCRALLTF
jgi:hypothetical protein